ncbi:MAG: APC family permease [Chloroflexi bacterium]|nr:APC family permease [Chloroflexota bacterium]
MADEPGRPAGVHRPGDRIYRPVRRPTGPSALPTEVVPSQERQRGTAAAHRPGDKIVRVVRGRELTLRRVIGIGGLFATGYGNVGSSIYYALGVTTLFALGAAPLALGVAGLFFILTVLTYTEATVAMPEAGGASSFARHGFNEMVSFVAGWATLMSYTVTISISVYSAAGYMAVFFPVLKQPAPHVAVAVAAIVLLMALNILGIQEATGFSLLFAAIDLAIQVVLVILGTMFLLNIDRLISQVNFGVAPTWPDFVYGIAVAMVAYTGIETISNMAGEARAPARTVPRSYAGLIFAVLVLFIGISTVALSAFPVECVDGRCSTELATTYLDDPVAGIAERMPPPFNHILAPIVGILASSILLIAANAGVIGVSRLAFSMGAHQQLPHVFTRIHSRFGTPYIAITIFSVAAVLLVLPGSITQLSEAYVFAAMLTFTLAHLSLIGMRVRKPGLYRAFKVTLGLPIAGRDIPLTAVAGCLGTASVWVLVVVTYPFGRWVGLGWMALGIALYVLYRRRLRLPLGATVSAIPSLTMVPLERPYGEPPPQEHSGRPTRT